MANKYRFYAIADANKEIDAAHAALGPILSGANVSTISVGGKPVSIADADLLLADKIVAIGSLIKADSSDKNVADLVVSNGQVADQLKEVSNKLAVTEATNGRLTSENSTLRSDLTVATNSLQKMTADAATSAMSLKTSNEQLADRIRDLNGANEQISRLCLDYDCLILTDTEGKPLAKDAADADKLAAANRVSIADKIKASRGAVNSAMARTGVNSTLIPTMPPKAMGHRDGKTEVTGRDRMKRGTKIAGRG